MEKKIAIMILNWNGSKDTIECLRSLSKISYKNKEIWVLDNGSKDDSVKKLKALKKKMNFNLVVSKENLGFAEGNNFLFSRIKTDSEFVMLLNNDAVVDKLFLEPLAKNIKKNIAITAPAVYNYFSPDKLSFNDFPGKFNFLVGGGRKLNISRFDQPVDYASGCCWLVRRSLFKKLKGFNEKYFAYNEEVEFAYRLKSLGYQTLVIQESRIWHKGEASSKKISGFRQYLQIRNSIWFERKYAGDYYPIFLLYLFVYKFPKYFIANLLSREDIRKKNKFLLKGILEGLKCAE